MSTVLVVDDDAAIRTVVAQALRRSGHDVTVADSLSQLERALAVAIPDVLITDVVLPDGDGIDHVRNVAERHPTLPIIVLSAQNTLTTAVRAAEVGAYEY
ncbi:MAG: response regulator, partial [Sphingomonas sp.]